MKRVFKTGSALLFASLLILTGCSGTNTANSAGNLHLAVNDAATSLNFLYTILEPNINIISNMTEGLVGYDKDNKLVGMSASDWTVSEDGLTYTFNIREDAKWSNGTNLTAKDFVYSIQTRAKDPEAVYANYYKYLKNGAAVLAGDADVSTLGVQAKADKELVFELTEPKAFFLDLLAFEIFYPLNQDFYETVGAESFGTSAETVLANGAFKLDTYNGEEGWTYSKNEYYWDKSNVALDTVDVRVIKEPSTQALMWENGELDVLDLTADYIDKYAADPLLQTALNPRMNYFYLSNTTGVPEPLLANKNFRAAIAHSIDKSIITESILKDGSVPADYFVPKDIINLDGVDFRDMSPNFKEPTFDAAIAQEYLVAAKSELGDVPLTFELNIYDLGETGKIYENIQSQIEKNLPGVTVTLNMIPTQIYFQQLYEYNTPAAASQWEPDYLDVENFFILFKSDASQNFAQWKNDAYDALYNEAESAAYANDPSGRWNKYIEAEKVLIDDYTIIPVYQNGVSYLVRDTVTGYQVNPAIPHVAYKYISKS